jgi:hypothetical protein
MPLFAIKGEIEFRLYLARRTPGHLEKPDEFRPRSSVKALCDIVHNGAGSGLDLTTQAEILAKSGMFGQLTAFFQLWRSSNLSIFAMVLPPG